MGIDIDKVRSVKNYKMKEYMARYLWSCVRFVFRWSPRSFFSWRAVILRVFGAKIGHHVHIYNNADIYMPWNLEVGDWSSIGEYVFIYNLGKVKIGEKSTISLRTHICSGTHDYTNPLLPLKKMTVDIGSQVWTCADSFIGPGVCVGEGAVVGARAVVIKDVKEWTVVAGNPAIYLKKRILL